MMNVMTRVAALAVASVVALGVVPAQAQAATTSKTIVTVTVRNTATETVVSWKYRGKNPKSQQLKVIAPGA
jgi:hypothetical protein